MADREPHVVTYAAACEVIYSLIEMVRARDRALRQIADATAINVALSNKLLAALDTLPAQEPTE